MNTVEIKPQIHWVGVVDWGVRDFHGYITQNGTTYNNYLINDEQVTLVDTVKHDFEMVTIENIKSIVDPSRVKNVIINHIEPDHASGLGRTMEYMPDAVIYITDRGKKGLERYHDTSKWNIKVVKNGDTLNIGKYNLLF